MTESIKSRTIAAIDHGLTQRCNLLAEGDIKGFNASKCGLCQVFRHARVETMAKVTCYDAFSGYECPVSILGQQCNGLHSLWNELPEIITSGYSKASAMERYEATAVANKMIVFLRQCRTYVQENFNEEE